MYRPYGRDIPSYLHNRPKSVIDSARQKIELAQDIPASHIKVTGTEGVFLVKSQEACEKWYLVSFGNEVQQPSCQCFSWVRNHFPCKHFFAIFRHHPQWGWDKLPDDYANSPLLTLDEAIIGHGKPINSSSSSHELVDNNAKSSMPNHDNFHGKLQHQPHIHMQTSQIKKVALKHWVAFAEKHLMKLDN